MEKLRLITVTALLTAFFASTGLAIPASAQEASAWSSTKGAAIRLLPGNATSGNGGLAGLEIRLEPGWKTYWRNPGDAGLPPVFDWSRSKNLGSVSVLWPAPLRIDDEGGSSAVYKDNPILPLQVQAKDTSRPIELNLVLDYALCHDICVPAKGEAHLVLPPAPGGSGQGADDIAAASRRVPVQAEIGTDGPLAIRAVRLDQSVTPAVLTVDTKSPTPASLFVEGPDKWYLPMPSPAADADRQNPQRFILSLEGLPKDAALSGTPLRLTLSTGDGGVESLYVLP